MKAVVKVQIPVFSNGEALPLVYDEAEMHRVEQVIPPKVFKTIKKSDNPYKGFFNATWDPITGTWLIGSATKWRNW